MKITSNNSHLSAVLLLLLLLLIVVLQILTSPAVSPSSLADNIGLDVEEKTRLGSTPPSCHNKCNECHPCFAVQVPTLPTTTTHDRLGPSSSSTVMEFYNLVETGNRYSNYKPLGWKCRCNNHFYNP